MTKKYFHYTPEVRIDEIIQSGKINLATASVYNKKEKACAWVSSNPIWEKTATKMVFDEFGNTTKLTFDEQLEMFGCARIEVKEIGLYSWNKLVHIAKMNPTFAEQMVRVGVEQGGKPSEWFGSLYPITKDKWIKAEIYKNGEWVEYKVF
ncbi:hypothetical protein [Flavobacterium terrigena]|uniref:Uncharacterized protein n=1 Tax=Flavobacterium terrigena TaxID=402734 RepID=A0A1H6UNK6_9FLAO|nr:hypothetical protein [Flavobacterium terrigena]SEI93858.1 hypothetical protein SAMN05660918_1980 [Flavobacterium terrigena]